MNRNYSSAEFVRDVSLPAAFGLALFVSLLLAPTSSSAEDSGTNYLNQVTVSARFGFNMSARFKGLAALPLPMSSRLTARGDHYNYDDGYVLTDNSGNFGGQTWYWGYDNSASQIAGNTVLLSRSTVMGGSAAQSLDSEPSVGAEVVFRRQLGGREWFRFGVEAAANYQNMTASGSSSNHRCISLHRRHHAADGDVRLSLSGQLRRTGLCHRRFPGQFEQHHGPRRRDGQRK